MACSPPNNIQWTDSSKLSLDVKVYVPTSCPVFLGLAPLCPSYKAFTEDEWMNIDALTERIMEM